MKAEPLLYKQVRARARAQAHTQVNVELFLYINFEKRHFSGHLENPILDTKWVVPSANWEIDLKKETPK